METTPKTRRLLLRQSPPKIFPSQTHRRRFLVLSPGPRRRKTNHIVSMKVNTNINIPNQIVRASRRLGQVGTYVVCPASRHSTKNRPQPAIAYAEYRSFSGRCRASPSVAKDKNKETNPPKIMHKKKYPNENVQVTEISKKCSEKWKVGPVAVGKKVQTETIACSSSPSWCN